MILSCEHARPGVPARFRHVLAGSEGLLRTHRGYDPGALEIARHLERRLGAPLVAQRWTRLLADANRSAHHPHLLSRQARSLPREERALLVERVWRPYREAVEGLVSAEIRRGGRCVHVSVHTFTPVLRGVRRDVDLGLLYDPSRALERGLADRVAAVLAEVLPRLRVRRNKPYRGVDDGFLPHLRGVHSPGEYVGLELETNQRFARAGGAAWTRVREALAHALETAVPRH